MGYDNGAVPLWAPSQGQGHFGPQNDSGGTPWGGIAGAGMALGGAILAGGNTGPYDPAERALKRFYELTDPNSDYFKKMRAMYARNFANAAPTTDAYLSLARAGGMSSNGAAALAYQQGKRDNLANTDRLNSTLTGHLLQTENMAQNYLGMDYQMRKDQQDNSGGLANQLLGLGGSLISKFLL